MNNVTLYNVFDKIKLLFAKLALFTSFTKLDPALIDCIVCYYKTSFLDKDNKGLMRLWVKSLPSAADDYNGNDDIENIIMKLAVKSLC